MELEENADSDVSGLHTRGPCRFSWKAQTGGNVRMIAMLAVAIHTSAANELDLGGISMFCIID